MAPPIVNASIKVLDLISKNTELRDKLEWNAQYFRKGVEDAGLCVRPGNTPIVPVMLYNAKLANDMSRDMYAEGDLCDRLLLPGGSRRSRPNKGAALSRPHEGAHRQGSEASPRSARSTAYSASTRRAS